MSEQDDPDLIEQAPRQFSLGIIPSISTIPVIATLTGTKRRRLFAIGTACVLLLGVAAAVTLTRVIGAPADPALAQLITEVTTVPVGTSLPGLPPPPVPSQGGSATVQLIDPGPSKQVSGPPLTAAGKPEILYVGAGYCPFCGMENWPLIVALSRFGRFAGLGASRTPEFEQIPPIDSWTFYGSSYTSPYLVFVPVETYSNVQVSANGHPDSAKGYRRLQKLTPAQQALLTKYDKPGSIPFVDFAGQAVQIGAGSVPSLFTGKTWQQIAADLGQPKTALGANLLDEADSLTAELCRLTGNRPATACPSFLTTAGLAP
jgi:Domain of unknown function (DUF929)